MYFNMEGICVEEQSQAFYIYFFLTFQESTAEKGSWRESAGSPFEPVQISQKLFGGEIGAPLSAVQNNK